MFTVTSYSENNGQNFTINGDGSGDPVVLNFGPTTGNINLGGDVALTGNGLNDDKVIWNFTNSNHAVSLNNNASSYPSVAFHGIILAPNDPISVVNANLSGRVFGGGNQDMQIVSGDTIHAPVLNTATVTASNVAFDSDDTASAAITITGSSFKPTNTPVTAGEFATIGFWHNQNGQAVIDSFNGSSSSTALGNWLATNWPNLFGASNPYTGTSLAGLTNAQIASVYANLWTPSGVTKNTYVQAFAVALGMYADTSTLGFDSTAQQFGFKPVSGGGGNATFNVGSNGAAFGVANNTTLSVSQILTDVDASFNAALGTFFNGNQNQQTLTSDLNNVLNGINTTGDVT